MKASSATMLMDWWKRLKGHPFGRKAFLVLLRLTVPYSGVLGAQIVKLEPGFAELLLKDRRVLRNHLGSIHAMALANFAELTSGLAFLSSQPPNSRAIVVGFSIDFLKKARGTLRATCECQLAITKQVSEFEVPVDILNQAGEVVAKAKARWRAELL